MVKGEHHQLASTVTAHGEAIEALVGLVRVSQQSIADSIASAAKLSIQQTVESGVIESIVRRELVAYDVVHVSSRASPSHVLRPERGRDDDGAALCQRCGGSTRFISEDIPPCTCPGAWTDWENDDSVEWTA